MNLAMKAPLARRWTACVIGAALVLGASCSDETATLGPRFAVLTAPARVELSVSVDTINALGHTRTLTAEVFDSAEAVLSDPVLWLTNNPDRATVVDGLVTATGRGLAQIIARSGPARDTALIFVRQIAKTVSLSAAPPILAVTDSFTFVLTATDSNDVAIEGANVVWRSSDEAVATVDATGKVHGLTAGSTIVTARLLGFGIESSILGRERVRVGYENSYFQISPETDTLTAIGATVQLTVPPVIIGGNPVAVEWTSLNPRMVSVDATGLVTALGRGTAQVTATAGEFADVVTIEVAPLPGTATIGEDSVSVPMGSSTTLSAVILDQLGTPMTQIAKWLSRDDAVATVDAAGLLTGVAEGTVWVLGGRGEAIDSVFVTVTAADGTSHVWVGAAGNWTDAAMWNPAVMPEATDTAYVLVAGADAALTEATTIGMLQMAASTAVSLETFNLSVTGDLLVDAAAALTSTGGILLLPGTGGVQGGVPTTQVTGTRSLSGDVTVNGALTIDNGGALTIETNALVIDNP